MSTCPSKDLHSVYLDNELPEIYKAEYEAHVKSCPKCQKELETLRNLQKMLRTDSKEITPDQHYLDQSFERLQIKLKYSENTKKAKSSFKDDNIIRKPNAFVYACIGAAAAAVVALIIPLRISGSKNSVMPASSSSVAVAPVTGAVAPAIATSVGLSNSFAGFNSTSNVSSAMGNMAATSVSLGGGQNNNVNLDSGKTVVISGNIDESAFAGERNGSVKKYFGQGSNIEIFRPDFDKSGAVYIKITLPGMEDVEANLQQ